MTGTQTAAMQVQRVVARLWAIAVAALVAAASPAQRAADWLLDPAPFVARAVPGGGGDELVLENGLLRAVFRLRPGLALVDLRQLVTGVQLLRSVRPLATIVVDGQEHRIGGLLGQPNHAFLLPEWLPTMTADPLAFHAADVQQGPIEPRLAWRRVRHHAPDAVWPPRGVHVAFACAPPAGVAAVAHLGATWHVELYDGIPLFACWLELHNRGERALELDRCRPLQLALVEGESRVDPARTPWRLPPVHVETDFAFGGMTAGDANSHVVHWHADPLYATQVHYERQTPCLLQVEPAIGPAQRIGPGGRFTSFRTFVLLPETDERDRQDLAQRRMYRVLAPWVTENPLMMHIRSAAPDAVRLALDQCRDVGFELAVMTFGSGFDIEDGSPANLDRWRELAAYAHDRGVELGGYSLLSSRRIEPDGDNCIDLATGKPGGQRFGFAPALASPWGQDYFQKLRTFFARTGFDLLEHDGSYPGDTDACARPPLQRGHDDSQWVQYSIISAFYRDCRARGVYLNVPDYYYLAGANKCGMGYRETNWSLPRDQQVLHARQNLFDGTRGKTPSMGWMFVPLTEYHGGGAAATIEPLDLHRDHYERMLASNLGYGAQACWRGPRLYDTDATKALVQQWVAWFRAHRDILESDVVHGSSRRACGRDLDWVLHANPRLAERGLLVVYNPTDAPLTRTLPLSLYFTGVVGRARVSDATGAERELALDPAGRTTLEVTVGPRGCSAFVVTAP